MGGVKVGLLYRVKVGLKVGIMVFKGVVQVWLRWD